MQAKDDAGGSATPLVKYGDGRGSTASGDVYIAHDIAKVAWTFSVQA